MTKYGDFALDPRQVHAPRGEDNQPGWAFGLRNLYRKVVNEPMPADFRDLVARLDRVA